MLIPRITASYNSPSLIDFENSKVSIEFTFLFPSKIPIGNMPDKRYYIADRPNYLILKLESISLQHSNYSIDISDLKSIGINKFEGTWKK